MWICQCSAYFRFIPSTRTHTQTHTIWRPQTDRAKSGHCHILLWLLLLLLLLLSAIRIWRAGNSHPPNWHESSPCTCCQRLALVSALHPCRQWVDSARCVWNHVPSVNYQRERVTWIQRMRQWRWLFLLVQKRVFLSWPFVGVLSGFSDLFWRRLACLVVGQHRTAELSCLVDVWEPKKQVATGVWFIFWLIF